MKLLFSETTEVQYHFSQFNTGKLLLVQIHVSQRYLVIGNPLRSFLEAMNYILPQNVDCPMNR